MRAAHLLALAAACGGAAVAQTGDWSRLTDEQLTLHLESLGQPSDGSRDELLRRARSCDGGDTCAARPPKAEPEELLGTYDYCIVGAGPGGLQLGQFLHNAGRSYTIFERQPQPGSFFARFPIHRGLISMNKRHTGRDNEEFNRRHDWNGLLGNDDVPSLRKRTTQRWPEASVLSEYLQDFARSQEDAGRIQYATNVNEISRDAASGVFTLRVLPSALDDESVWYFDKQYRDVGDSRAVSALEGAAKCSNVIMATGLWVPNKLPMRGIELTEGYESLATTGEGFAGQNVAIFGLGNAAFEAANSINEYANFVHMWPTRLNAMGNANLPTSWESRYIGALRATRTAVLDGYMMGALDSLPVSGKVVAEPERMMIVKCFGERRCLFDLSRDANGDQVVQLGYYDPEIPEQREFVERMEAMGLDRVDEMAVNISQSKIARIVKTPRARGSEGPGSTPAFDVAVGENTLALYAEKLVVYADNVTEANVDAVMGYRQRSGVGDRLTQPYDAVIRGTGWKHNLTVYHPSARPLLQSNRKFPRMTAEYESVNVPGMYFAGTYSHGKDLKRGVTSVIKGFRYTARALFRILSEKHFGEDHWNTRDYCLPAQQDELAAHANMRMNVASAPYLVFYSIGDGIVFEPNNETGVEGCAWKARYREEVPIDFFTEQHGDKHRMWWSFGFDGQPRELDYVMNRGTGFEPWFWYFSPDDREGHTTKAVAGQSRDELQKLKFTALLALLNDPELGLSQDDIDEALEDDVPKQAAIELIVSTRTALAAAAGAEADEPQGADAKPALKQRYKEILRFIENVRTEWKSDYFVYNMNRYMKSKIQEIMALDASLEVRAALEPNLLLNQPEMREGRNFYDVKTVENFKVLTLSRAFLPPPHAMRGSCPQIRSDCYFRCWQRWW